jgi:hypothetical protein
MEETGGRFLCFIYQIPLIKSSFKIIIIKAKPPSNLYIIYGSDEGPYPINAIAEIKD